MSLSAALPWRSIRAGSASLKRTVNNDCRTVIHHAQSVMDPARSSDWGKAVHPLRGNSERRSDQAGLLHRRFHKAGEERMWIEGLALQFGMELHTHEPGVIGSLDNFGQQSVR